MARLISAVIQGSRLCCYVTDPETACGRGPSSTLSGAVRVGGEQSERDKDAGVLERQRRHRHVRAQTLQRLVKSDCRVVHHCAGRPWTCLLQVGLLKGWNFSSLFPFSTYPDTQLQPAVAPQLQVVNVTGSWFDDIIPWSCNPKCCRKAAQLNCYYVFKAGSSDKLFFTWSFGVCGTSVRK